MRAKAEWQLFTSATGNSVVAREIQNCALNAREQGTLQRLLDRVESGETLKKDTKYLKHHDLFEARLDGDRRIFRLFFVKREEGRVLLGLYFVSKKSDKLPKAAFATAKRRRDEWDERHPK